MRSFLDPDKRRGVSVGRLAKVCLWLVTVRRFGPNQPRTNPAVTRPTADLGPSRAGKSIP